MSAIPAIGLALAGMAAVVAFEAYRMIRQMARRQAWIEYVVGILCKMAIQHIEELEEEKAEESKADKRVN